MPGAGQAAQLLFLFLHPALRRLLGRFPCPGRAERREKPNPLLRAARETTLILFLFYFFYRIIGWELGHGEFGCLEKGCGAVQPVLGPTGGSALAFGCCPRPPRGSPTPNYGFLHPWCPGCWAPT